MRHHDGAFLSVGEDILFEKTIRLIPLNAVLSGETMILIEDTALLS